MADANDPKQGKASSPHMGVLLSEIHSDEPHEGINAAKTEVRSWKAQGSHLSSHGTVFDVGKAFESEHEEIGTIVSDKKHHRPSIGETLRSAFGEWWGNLESAVSDTVEAVPVPKKEKPTIVEKAEVRKEIVAKAVTLKALPPKDDHHIVVQKIRTFKQDVARVTGAPQAPIKSATPPPVPPQKKEEEWIHVVKEEVKPKQTTKPLPPPPQSTAGKTTVTPIRSESGDIATRVTALYQGARPQKSILPADIEKSVTPKVSTIPTPPQQVKPVPAAPSKAQELPIPKVSPVATTQSTKAQTATVPTAQAVPQPKITPTWKYTLPTVPKEGQRTSLSQKSETQHIPTTPVEVVPKVGAQTTAAQIIKQADIASSLTPKEVQQKTTAVPTPKAAVVPETGKVIPTPRTAPVQTAPLPNPPANTAKAVTDSAVKPLAPATHTVAPVQNKSPLPHTSGAPVKVAPPTPPQAQTMKQAPLQKVTVPGVLRPKVAPLTVHTPAPEVPAPKPQSPAQTPTPKAPVENRVPPTTPVLAPKVAPVVQAPATNGATWASATLEEEQKQPAAQPQSVLRVVPPPAPQPETPRQMPPAPKPPVQPERPRDLSALRPQPVRVPEPPLPVKPPVETPPPAPSPAPIPQPSVVTENPFTPDSNEFRGTIPPARNEEASRTFAQPYTAQSKTVSEDHSNRIRLIMRIAIIVLIIGVGAGLALLAKNSEQMSNVFGKGSEAPRETIPPTPFIRTDVQVGIPLGTDPYAFTTTLRESIAKAPAGVVQFYPTAGTESGGVPVTTEVFFTTMNSTLSARTVRALDETMMLGSVTAGAENVPFVVIRSYNYDVLFSGLLAWESEIQSEFDPLFGTPENGTTFTDAVRFNKSIRILKNSEGKEILLYAFVNQNTVVITTNGEALAKLLERI